MDRRTTIIVATILSIFGVILIIVIICFIYWFIRRRKSKLKSQIHDPVLSHRKQYERSQKSISMKYVNNRRRERKKRFNTNDSSLSLPFHTPHLINQNVKNLDQLVLNETSLINHLWHDEHASPTIMQNDFYR